MYKNLMVPLDGSPFSARALTVAAALAKRTGAALHLVIVHDPTNYIPFVPGEVAVPVFDTELVTKRRADDLKYVSEQAAALTATGLKASGTLLEGTVVEALAEHAGSLAVDLVVMTTHGRSGLERLWLGSVASALLARCPSPVFLVRPTGDEAPVFGQELPSGSVLVPLDGSPFAETIVPHARTFASALGLSLELLSVVVPHAVPMAPFGTEALLADNSDLSAQEAEARVYLERIAGNAEPTTRVSVQTDLVAARAILSVAAQHGTGAIAMATHGRSGIRRLMVGSVADKVLRGAHLPMLVYHPDDNAK